MFQKVSQEEVFKGSFLKVVRARYETSDQIVVEREYIVHPGAVTVVPVDEENVAYALWQFRAPVGKEIFEVCAGKRDVEGEPPSITAERELQEEMGFTASQIIHLGSFFNSPGICDEQTDIYLALGLQKTQASPQSPEERLMRVASFNLDQVPRLIAEGIILDAKTIVTLYAAINYLKLRGDSVAKEN